MPRVTDSPSRILIVLPTWVGDAVMATPALRSLRRQLASAHIAWMGGRVALDTLAGLPWADERIVDPSKGGGLTGLWRAARRLRRERFDLAVMLSNAFRVALVCLLGHVHERVGYDRDRRGWMLTTRVPTPREANGRLRVTPALSYYLTLAERLGCDVSNRTMELAVEPDAAAEADALLAAAGIDGSRPIVVINPAASFGSSKLWMPARFAAVADALMDRYAARIIINAAPAEKPIAAAVAEGMTRAPAINFAERDNTLGLLKAIAARATLMITGDTGPRHVAAALGCGVVTLFGSTDPGWTTIDCPRERIVRVDVPCSPCQQKVCPLPAGAEHHRCMEAITVEMVLEAATDLLVTVPSEASP